MNYQQLKQILQNQMETDPIIVTGDILQSPPISRMVTNLFETDRLRIRHPVWELQDEREEIILRGEIEEAMLGAEHLQVSITFFVAEGTTQLSMLLSEFSDKWHLRDAFPSLKDTIFDTFLFSRPQFFFESQGLHALPSDFQGSEPHITLGSTWENRTIVGVQFEATLSYCNEASPLHWLFSQSPHLIKGIIEIVAGIPRISLQGQVTGDASLGPFRLPLEIQLISMVGEWTDEETKQIHLYPYSYIQVMGKLLYTGSQQEVSIPITAKMMDIDRPTLILQSNLKEASAVTLDEIAGMLQQTSVGEYFPDLFPTLKSLFLEKIMMEILIEEQNVLNLSVSVGFDQVWEFLPGVQMSKMKLLFATINPFSQDSQIHLQVTAFGEVAFTDIPGAIFQGYVSLPELHFGVEMPPDQEIQITSFLQQYLQAELPLPDLACSSFRLEGDAVTKSFSSSIDLKSNWGIIPGYVAIQGAELSLEIENAFDASQREIAGGVLGVFQVGTAQLWLEAYREERTWTFSGGLMPEEDVKLSDIIHTLLPEGAGIPDELPDLVFSDVEVSVTPHTGEFSLSGTCSSKWELPFGVSDLLISSVTIKLEREAGKKDKDEYKHEPQHEVDQYNDESSSQGVISCSLELHGKGPVTITDSLVFKEMNLVFDYKQKEGWKVAGSIAAQLFEANYELAASLEVTSTERTLQLRAKREATTPLITLTGIGSFDAKEIAIEITKSLKADNDTDSNVETVKEENGKPVQLNKKSLYTWSVAVSGGLHVQLIASISVAGSIMLYKKSDMFGFLFKADYADVAIPLPITGYHSKLHLGLAQLGIERKKTKSGKTAWGFAAEIDVWFTDLPPSIQKLLPKRTKGTAGLSSDGLQLAVDRLLQPIKVKVPDAEIGDLYLEMGDALIDASNLEVTISRKELSLSLDFGFGIPAEFNTVFGKKADGTASVAFFNTYQPNKPESVTRLQLSLDMKNGLAIQLLTSPIQAVVLKDGWWHCDLGEYGAIKLRAPVFSYNGSSFTANGGFEQVEGRPLKLPLTPLKALLRAASFSDVADMLPNGVPLLEVQVFDKKGSLQTTEFIRLLERATGGRLSQSLANVLKQVEKHANRLPDRLKRYLSIELPDGFEFDISVSQTGGASIKVSAQGDKSLRFIYPTIGPMALPTLVGMELKSFSFGEIFGGALLLLEADMRIDTFNLLTIAQSLLIPTGKQKLLPDSRTLMQQIIIDELTMLIIYQTEVPIPIPVFYKQLGIEYLGFEGFAFQTHASFPKPSFHLAEANCLIGQFSKFFTEPAYLLSAEEAPEDMNLTFTLGANYVELPNYLGEKTLGTKETTLVIKLYEHVAHLLNGMKTLRVNELVQAVPLAYRVGKEQISFVCIEMEAMWIITTPEEFRREGYKYLESVDTQIESILSVVPKKADEKEQGIITLLKGHWTLFGSSLLDVFFGIAATNVGIGTGLRIAGNIGRLLAVQIEGTILITPEGEEVFGLNGHADLQIAGKSVMNGTVSASEKHLLLKGSVDLFPHSSLLRVTGHVDGYLSENDFHLSADCEFHLGHLFTLVGGKLLLTQHLVTISGTWLKQKLTLEMQQVGDQLQLRTAAHLCVNLGGSSIPLIVELPGGGKANFGTVSLHFAADVELLFAMNNNDYQLSAHVRFKFGGKELAFHMNIDVAYRSWSEMVQAIVKHIGVLGWELFKKVCTDSSMLLKYAKDQLIVLTDQVVHVLKDIYHQTKAEAEQFLRNAGFPVDEILNLLKIFEQTFCPTRQALRLMSTSPYSQNQLETPSFLDVFYDIQKQLQTSPKGNSYLDIYYNNKDEVNALLNNNDNVKKVFKRQGGVEWVENMALSFKHHEMTFDQKKLSQALSILQVLGTNGSERLQDAVIDVTDEAQQYMNLTYEQVMQKIKEVK